MKLYSILCFLIATTAFAGGGPNDSPWLGIPQPQANPVQIHGNQFAVTGEAAMRLFDALSAPDQTWDDSDDGLVRHRKVEDGLTCQYYASVVSGKQVTCWGDTSLLIRINCTQGDYSADVTIVNRLAVVGSCNQDWSCADLKFESYILPKSKGDASSRFDDLRDLDRSLHGYSCNLSL